MSLSPKVNRIIKEENLIKTILNSHNIQAYKRILTQSLNITNKEKLVIISDIGYPSYRVPMIMGLSYAIAAKDLGINYDLIFQEPKINLKEPAEPQVIDALYNAENKVFAITLSHKIGSLGKLSKSYRKLIREHGQRFVSTPGLAMLANKHYQLLLNAIDIDYKKLDQIAKLLKMKIEKSRSITIMKYNYRLDVTIDNYNWIINSGLYTNPGEGGNIPAGEVYAPVKDADGDILIDGSIKTMNRTILVDSYDRILIQIRNGKIKNIEGTEKAIILLHGLKLAQAMCKTTKSKENVMKIAELGIGINPKAKVAGPTIINEKAQYTCHIAFGSNYWFGGHIKAPVHLDQVIRNPNIYIECSDIRKNCGSDYKEKLDLKKIFRLY